MDMKDSAALSVRDKIFGALAALSALYGFAVSFALSLPSGRERFLVALTVFVISFLFVKQKKGVALGILAFIALRFAWAAMLSLVKH